MKYNPNFHHRRSVRLKGFDYSKAGLYFITICCKNRECFFGEIVKNGTDQNMFLSRSGIVAQDGWFEIPLHFPEAVLHEFVVMPNHIHGIIEIDYSVEAKHLSPGNEESDVHVGAKHLSPNGIDSTNIDSRANVDSPLQSNKRFKSPSKTIGSIIRGYKIGVTKWHRANTDICDVWQRSFHDHVIRDERGYINISNYIKNNPNSWDDDMFYKS